MPPHRKREPTPPRGAPGTIWVSWWDVTAATAARPTQALVRPADPRPLIVAPGGEYLLHVWEDGLEQDVGPQVPRHWRSTMWTRGVRQTEPVTWYWIGGALTVLVALVSDTTVVERTTTVNAESYRGAELVISPVPPRGRNWTMFDATDEKSTIWQRRRTWEVVS